MKESRFHAISFYVFNVLPELYRDNVQRAFSVSLEEWSRLKPGTVGDRVKYKKLKSGDTYRKRMKGSLN